MMRLAKSIATVSSALVLALCFTAGAFAQAAPAQQSAQKPATKPAANAAAKPAAAATQSAPNTPAKPVAKTAMKPVVNTTAAKPAASAATKPAASTAIKTAVSPAMASAASKATPAKPGTPGGAVKTAVAAKPPVAAKPIAAKPVAVKPAMAKPIATKPAKTAAAPKTASTAPKPAPKAAPAVGMTASPDQAPVASDEPVGARRDPFVSLVNDRKESGGQVLPPGEAGLVVSTVRVDGTVKSGSDLIAVVSNPERHVYFIREGDHLYDGSVVRIDLDGVTFHEESKDAFGKPVVREVTKRIYATAGEQQ